MGFSNGTPTISTDGLIFAVDAGNGQSYVSGSSTCTSLVSSATGNLINDTQYEDINQGVWAFDGVNDIINCGTLSSITDNVSKLSISFWFKLDDTDESRWAGKYSNTARWISCQQNSSSDILFIISDGTTYPYGYFEAIDSGLVVIDTWYHIAFVYDGTESGNANRCKIYLNGNLRPLIFNNIIPATTYDFSSLGSPPDWRIGGDGWLDNANGNITSFQIRNSAPTAAEVLQNYNTTKERFI